MPVDSRLTCRETRRPLLERGIASLQQAAELGTVPPVNRLPEEMSKRILGTYIIAARCPTAVKNALCPGLFFVGKFLDRGLHPTDQRGIPVDDADA